MCDKRDSQKKRFIEALTAKGTVYHTAKAAGVSRWTAYRWRSEDKEFREAWDDALENAIDELESSVCQRGLAGDTLAAMFWLKAHRPEYRDRLPPVDKKKMQAEIKEITECIKANSDQTQALSPDKSEKNKKEILLLSIAHPI